MILINNSLLFILEEKNPCALVINFRNDKGVSVCEKSIFKEKSIVNLPFFEVQIEETKMIVFYAVILFLPTNTEARESMFFLFR